VVAIFKFEIKRRFFRATCDFIAATIAIAGASDTHNPGNLLANMHGIFSTLLFTIFV
jgi:hypothetical protein